MEWKEAALEKVRQLLGAEVMIMHKQEQIKWAVVADSTTELGTEEDRGSLGVRNFNVHDYAMSVVSGRLFLHIACQIGGSRFINLTGELMHSTWERQVNRRFSYSQRRSF